MSNHLQYSITGSDGEVIVEDLVTSVKQVLESFASVDWQAELQTEIEFGANGRLGWPAHTIIERSHDNFIMIVPSPYGLGGKYSFSNEKKKMFFLKTTEQETIEFEGLALKDAGPIMKNYILNKHEELLVLVGEVIKGP